MKVELKEVENQGFKPFKIDLNNEIISQKKKLGLPYRIAFDKWLRHNSISKSILTFAEMGKLQVEFDKHWD